MTLLAQDRVIPAPFVSPEIGPFFEGTAAGRLMLKHCDGCDRVHYYPRAICPHCFSTATRWVAASGLGRIYTYSVSRLGVPVPFAIAYVELDEGVTVMSNLVDCDLDALAIGQRVKVVFKPSENDGPLVPMFTPIGG